MKYTVNYTRELDVDESGYLVVDARNPIKAKQKAREVLLSRHYVKLDGHIEKWKSFGTEYRKYGIRISYLKVEGGEE